MNEEMMMMESNRMAVRMVLGCVRDDEEEQGGHVGVAVLFFCVVWEREMLKERRRGCTLLLAWRWVVSER